MTDEVRVLRDRYRLQRSLSENGASSTYEAVDEETGQRCVVKELSVGAVVREGSTATTYDGDFTKLVDLFEREARVLSNLDHPAVPRFIDHFRERVGDDTRLYTVQEFVEGQTLEALVQGGRHVTEDEAIRICRETVEVLGYLHDRSPPLIHRDVKPSNIIIGTDGEIHLVDFGSVRNLIEAEPLDGKTIVGTYGYMPIEQYEARAVPQSDFYALGMTLIYLLSHKDPTRIPRTGLTLDFRSHVNVSDRFARLIGWMIAPAPEDRPPDAAAILQLLSRDHLQLPDLFQPTTPTRVAADPRLKSAMALGAGILAFLIAAFGFLGLGVPFVPDQGAGTRPGTPETAALPVTPAPEGVGDLRPRAAAPYVPAGDVRPRAATPDVPVGPVVAVNGVLEIDMDRDFAYVDAGRAMGRTYYQTWLPPLAATSPRGLTVPPVSSAADVLYGSLVLGDGPDSRVDFALVGDGVDARLHIDRNNNEDLTDDGPPAVNEGSGSTGGMGARVTLDITVMAVEGERLRRYGMWIWFTLPADGRELFGRMYARHHYAGTVQIGSEVYEATIFQPRGHDGLYRDEGMCIDLDGDEECLEEAELFFDGAEIMTPGGTVRLVLMHP